MSGLHLVIWPLYFCFQSLWRIVYCETFIPTLWRILFMSLTVDCLKMFLKTMLVQWLRVSLFSVQWLAFLTLCIIYFKTLAHQKKIGSLPPNMPCFTLCNTSRYQKINEEIQIHHCIHLLLWNPNLFKLSLPLQNLQRGLMFISLFLLQHKS